MRMLFSVIYMYFFLIKVEKKSPVEEEAEAPATETSDLDEVPFEDEEPDVEETSNTEVTPAPSSDAIKLKVSQGKFLTDLTWVNWSKIIGSQILLRELEFLLMILCWLFASDIDGLITQALLIGDYEAAVNLCLHDNRMADSIILAIAGGPELLAKTQKKYFSKTQSKISKVRSCRTTVDMLLMCCR